MSLSTEKTRCMDTNALVCICAAFPCPRSVPRSTGLRPRKASGALCHSLNYRRHLASVPGLCKYELRLDALSKRLGISKGWKEKTREISAISIAHAVRLFPCIRISPSHHEGHNSVKGWQKLREDVTSILGPPADTLLRLSLELGWMRSGKKQM